LIFKNSNLIIFQFAFQAKLFTQYYEDKFSDDTFHVTPKFSYQVFITRTFINPNYIFDIYIYIKIKRICQKNNYDNILKLLYLTIIIKIIIYLYMMQIMGIIIII